MKIYNMQSFHSYECGFDPYGDIHYRYDIRFYVICLLFLLFDIEIVYLYPIIYNFNFYSYNSVFIFIFVLILGLVYEYKYSSL